MHASVYTSRIVHGSCAMCCAMCCALSCVSSSDLVASREDAVESILISGVISLSTLRSRSSRRGITLFCSIHHSRILSDNEEW